MRRRYLLGLLAVAPVTSSHAAEPGLAPPPGAALPLGLPVRDATGRPLTLGEALGGLPTVFVFADYDCTTLCGTTLGLAAAALPGTGLRPGQDYRLVVLGLDAADGPDKAMATRQAWLGDSGALARTAAFLVAREPALATAMQALGYAVVRRGDGFDHPLALFVLQGDGRLSAVLPALGSEPEELRAALRDAGRAPPPGLFAQVRLLCAAAAAGHGGSLRGVLTAGGAATLGLLAGGLVLLRRREPGA